MLALQLLSVAPNHYSRLLQLSAGRVQSTLLQRTTVRLRYSTCTDGSRTPACVQQMEQASQQNYCAPVRPLAHTRPGHSQGDWRTTKHSCDTRRRRPTPSETLPNLAQHMGQLLHKVRLPLFHSKQAIRQLSTLMPAGQAKGR